MYICKEAYYCTWFYGRKASVEIYDSVSFLGQGHIIVKVWVMTSGFDIDQAIFSFKKKVEKWEGTLRTKKAISKNKVWDKIKGVKVIMEIGMKSICDCFQGWRFKTTRKGFETNFIWSLRLTVSSLTNCQD